MKDCKIRIPSPLWKHYNVKKREYGVNEIYTFICEHCEEKIEIMWQPPSNALYSYNKEEVDRLKNHLVLSCPVVAKALEKLSSTKERKKDREKSRDEMTSIERFDDKLWTHGY